MARVLNMFLALILRVAVSLGRPFGPRCRLVALAAFVSFAARVPASHAESGAVEVDAEIVLAVDISYSMDTEEQQLQRSGYIEALTSPEFFNALQSGVKGSIALTYVEWASAADQQVVIGWRLIDGPLAARKFSNELAAANFRRAYRTSIAGAIDFSTRLFAANGFSSPRRIIDISGDGPNNDGRWVTAARDDAVAHGITINGLPLLIRPPRLAYADIDNLDAYYADCVIGGAGAFIVPVKDTQAFVTATRTKLVLEISARPTAAPIRPIEADKPRVSCTIGETLLQQRLGN
jgi:hypothetical protein